MTVALLGRRARRPSVSRGKIHCAFAISAKAIKVYPRRAIPVWISRFTLASDNRIETDFLARAYSLLEESPAHVGWIYPDLDMFGVTHNHTTRGSYSPLMHLAENYCEAGSL